MAMNCSASGLSDWHVFGSRSPAVNTGSTATCALQSSRYSSCSVSRGRRRLHLPSPASVESLLVQLGRACSSPPSPSLNPLGPAAVCSSFNAWTAFIFRMRRTRNMSARAIARFKNLALAKCFQPWANHARRVIFEKHVATSG